MSEYRADRSPLVEPGNIDHHVADMTATFAADVTLADAQAALAKAQQWLPIDGDPQLKLGRLVETNSSGPLRLGYGHWRDLLLGAQFRNGKDELITAGGRTVKNVAGYDLTKFMVGQAGIFGTLVTLTTRTYKRPAGAILATFPPQPSLMHRLIPSPQKPQWAMLTRGALLCGYVSDERTLAYYEKSLADWSPTKIETRSLEEDIAHRSALWQGEFRAAVPPASLGEFIAAAKPARWSADAAFGIVVGSVDDREALRKSAARFDGVVSFYPRDGSAAGPAVDFVVPPGAQRELLERLKQQFDPDQKLNPLPWQHA